ncbi:MAG: DegT/DnrJ/EryC1/StrS family aminotransferase [Phycisphaerae bacterium]
MASGRSSKLAVDGGKPIRKRPFPPRGLITRAEKAAVVKLFDEAIASGEAPGYNGPNEKEYERRFVQFMGGGYADAVNSGTNAVFAALGALQLDALSEVIVPPITDPGGVMPVLFVGCVPVMADSDPRSYNTSAAEIAPLINKRTRAIVVAHIAGNMVDMDPILALARKHKLYVVEDCAQSHGATYKGRLAGTMGDIAAFSTMFGKHHCTGGQGGVVYTRNEELHWRGRRFADRGKPFGITPAPGGNVVAGLNCNLNELSAAVGIAQLKRLPSIVRRRMEIGDAIRDGLKKRCRAVSMGWQVPRSRSVYWFGAMRLDPTAVRVDKDTFCKALAAEGLPITPSYRHIPCEAPWFKARAVFGSSGFPWTCSDYRGPRDPSFKMDNVLNVCATHFNLAIHENYGRREIADILAAFEKVEWAYIS